MTDERYVKLSYPDAFCDYSERYKAYAVAIQYKGEQTVIGISDFAERVAWKNAKDWVRSLPAEDLPEE